MIVKEHIFRDIARLFIWYPVRWFVSALPVPVAFRLFSALGDLNYFFCRKKMDNIRRNIASGLKNTEPGEVEKILRTYLQNHYLDRLHIFKYPELLKKRNSDRVMTLTGTELLQNILQQGTGAILALGHYGPIQLPLFSLGQNGFNVIQIGLPFSANLSWIGKNVAFRLRLKYESLIPAEIFPASKFLRPVLKHLKSNGVIMITIDPAGGGQWIGRMEQHTFFGNKMVFPVGAAALALKTHTPILPVSITRSGIISFKCTIHQPIYNGSDSLSASEITEKLVRWYEMEVSQDPGLWHFWDEFEPGKLLASSGTD